MFVRAAAKSTWSSLVLTRRHIVIESSITPTSPTQTTWSIRYQTFNFSKLPNSSSSFSLPVPFFLLLSLNTSMLQFTRTNQRSPYKTSLHSENRCVNHSMRSPLATKFYIDRQKTGSSSTHLLLQGLVFYLPGCSIHLISVSPTNQLTVCFLVYHIESLFTIHWTIFILSIFISYPKASARTH